QAAYELSKILTNDPHALDQEPGAREQVRRMFKEASEPEVKQYLALVLRRTEGPERHDPHLRPLGPGVARRPRGRGRAGRRPGRPRPRHPQDRRLRPGWVGRPGRRAEAPAAPGG